MRTLAACVAASLALAGCAQEKPFVAHYAPEKITAPVMWLEQWADPVLIHDAAPYAIPTRGFDEKGEFFFLQDGADFYGTHRHRT